MEAVRRVRQVRGEQAQEAYQAAAEPQARAAQARAAQDPTSMLWQNKSPESWDFRLAGVAMGMLLPLQARAAVLLPLRARVPLQWPWIH